MSCSELWVFVEGPDDQRFFERIIVRALAADYDPISFYRYAERKPEQVTRFLRSLQRRNKDYLFVHDINSCPCVTRRRQQVCDKYSIPDAELVVVVVREIEGWYLAGLDKQAARHLKVEAFQRTDTVTKDHFVTLIPDRSRSIVAFRLHVLDHFNIDEAKRKNASFRYFCEKYGLSQ